MKSLIKFVLFIFSIIILLQGWSFAAEKKYVLYVSNRDDVRDGIINVTLLYTLNETLEWLNDIANDYPPPPISSKVIIYPDGTAQYYFTSQDGLLIFYANPGDKMWIYNDKIFSSGFMENIPDVSPPPPKPPWVAYDVGILVNLREHEFDPGATPKVDPEIIKLLLKIKEKRKAIEKTKIKAAPPEKIEIKEELQLFPATTTTTTTTIPVYKELVPVTTTTTTTLGIRRFR